MDNTYQKNIGGYKIEVTSNEILKYYEHCSQLYSEEFIAKHEVLLAYHVAKQKYADMVCKVVANEDFFRGFLMGGKLRKGKYIKFKLKLADDIWNILLNSTKAGYCFDAYVSGRVEIKGYYSDTIENVVLYCLNGFNENLGIGNKYQSINDLYK